MEIGYPAHGPGRVVLNAGSVGRGPVNILDLVSKESMIVAVGATRPQPCGSGQTPRMATRALRQCSLPAQAAGSRLIKSATAWRTLQRQVPISKPQEQRMNPLASPATSASVSTRVAVYVPGRSADCRYREICAGSQFQQRRPGLFSPADAHPYAYLARCTGVTPRDNGNGRARPRG